MADARATRGRAALRIVISIVACGALVGGAIGLTILINASEPTAQQEGATRRSAALVETIDVQRGTYRPRLQVIGIVEPAQDVWLAPRVGGQVIRRDASLEPGGLVTTGQELLVIDPVDFERALAVRRSELLQVQAELAIEEGRQAVAREEFELLGEKIDPANRALVLREPQIASIRARVEAAEAAVAQAELDLERTRVRAPFDAQVLERQVELGSQIAEGEELAHLVGVDRYHVVASVPLRDIRWLDFESEPGDGTGSPVTVRHATAWGPDEVRVGSVTRLIGTVDDRTRLARVLVSVPDPLARTAHGPPLILGTFVEVTIEGRTVENVVRLDRAYLRRDDTVWVMKDDALEIRPVDVAFRDEGHVYVQSGLDAGDAVITTTLATVREGLELRRIGAPDAVAEATP